MKHYLLELVLIFRYNLSYYFKTFNYMFLSQTQFFGGFDKSSQSIRIAVLKLRKGEWSVHHLKEIPNAPTSKPFETLPGETFYTTGVHGSEVLVRPLNLKVTKENDVLAALEFQVENIFPFASSKGLYQAQVLKKEAGSSSLSVVALKKESLKQHLSTLSFEPECITSIPQALSRLTTLFPEISPGEQTLILHADDQHVHFAVSCHGNLLKSLVFTYQTQDELRLETRKALLSLSIKNFNQLFILGPQHEKLSSIVEQLCPGIAKKPTAPSLHLPDEKLMRYGLAIGIAMMGSLSSRLNFRQEEFAYPRPLRRLWRPLSMLFASSLVLTLICVGLSHTILSMKRSYLEKEYATLVQSLEKPAPSLPSKGNAEFFSIALQQVEKTVEQLPNTFPLLPGVPKVKDFLGWLSELPASDGIIFTSFHYTIERRPENTRPNDRYKVRVMLELTSSSAMSAKEFKEALQFEKGPYIDTNAPMTWEQVKGVYRTSFYLKDKTRYS